MCILYATVSWVSDRVCVDWWRVYWLCPLGEPQSYPSWPTVLASQCLGYPSCARGALSWRLVPLLEIQYLQTFAGDGVSFPGNDGPPSAEARSGHGWDGMGCGGHRSLAPPRSAAHAQPRTASRSGVGMSTALRASPALTRPLAPRTRATWLRPFADESLPASGCPRGSFFQTIFYLAPILVRRYFTGDADPRRGRRRRPRWLVVWAQRDPRHGAVPQSVHNFTNDSPRSSSAHVSQNIHALDRIQERARGRGTTTCLNDVWSTLSQRAPTVGSRRTERAWCRGGHYE